MVAVTRSQVDYDMEKVLAGQGLRFVDSLLYCVCFLLV